MKLMDMHTWGEEWKVKARVAEAEVARLREALERIAAALRVPEWDADTFEEIALAVRQTGRDTESPERAYIQRQRAGLDGVGGPFDPLVFDQDNDAYCEVSDDYAKNEGSTKTAAEEAALEHSETSNK